MPILHSFKESKLEYEDEDEVEVFSTWMAFGGNTCDLGSFGEETDEITDLYQILKEVLLTERRDGVAGIKRRRRDPSSDGVKDLVVQIVLWYLDCGCSKHMTGNRSQLMNFVSKFLGTVRFGNDQVAKIIGDTNLYIISLDEMLKTSLVYLLSKASKTKSWLWHRRLSHLNFGTLNKLAKDGLARGIPKLKFQKDNLCSACALGKSKKSSHQPKAEDNNQEKLYLLHMDLCGPMRVESINGKKYILVIVDDYS
ncbi:gag-pol polyprotein [Tanacetum coccineum]